MQHGLGGAQASVAERFPCGKNGASMFKSISRLQERDTCLALTFLLLLVWFFTRRVELVYAAMIFLLVGMVWSSAMRPLAFLWFGLSHLLGKVMSTLLLSLVYVVILLPVAGLRRLMGKDSLRLRQWRSGGGSCFIPREHAYTAEDLKHPY